MSDERIKVKTTIFALLPPGKSLNDFNEAVLAAIGQYAARSDPSWRTAGFSSIETRLDTRKKRPE